MSLTWTYETPAEGETAVEVTCTETNPQITHTRGVNAVFTDGTYDATLTEQRVSEVGASVSRKIGLGVITAPTDSDGGE
jgi:hypothetical protein